ncbi:hypothetical protein [Streptomyces puniciscabiei]|uniref:hypothetical protein n=1 Tax=Streptomyces puniciscabiei TaxID=164348 RepID=UPI0006EBA2D1|nr:hypothetical protein [Streptomyces puniciscabiei]
MRTRPIAACRSRGAAKANLVRKSGSWNRLGGSYGDLTHAGSASRPASVSRYTFASGRPSRGSTSKVTQPSPTMRPSSR